MHAFGIKILQRFDKPIVVGSEPFEIVARERLSPMFPAVSAKQLLKKLHKDNKKDPLFSYLLGNVALREKDAKQATAYFELAVSIDPQHIESSRQLRILRMRQKGSELSTIFQRFKKK